MKLCESIVMDLSMEQRLAVRFCFKAGKSASESLQTVNAAYGAKHYSIRSFPDGMDGFVMELKTVKTAKEVAGLQIVASATILGRFLNCCFKTVTVL
jgi:hypothetical protein